MRLSVISRRVFVGAAMTAPIAGVARARTSLSGPERLKRQLGGIAARMGHGSLDLRRFDEHDNGLTVVIRLRWPAGMRQRKFSAVNPDPEVSLAQISSEIEAYFLTLT